MSARREHYVEYNMPHYRLSALRRQRFTIAFTYEDDWRRRHVSIIAIMLRCGYVGADGATIVMASLHIALALRIEWSYALRHTSCYGYATLVIVDAT